MTEKILNKINPARESLPFFVIHVKTSLFIICHYRVAFRVTQNHLGRTILGAAVIARYYYGNNAVKIRCWRAWLLGYAVKHVPAFSALRNNTTEAFVGITTVIQYVSIIVSPCTDKVNANRRNEPTLNLYSKKNNA